MKRTVCIIISALMLLTLAACTHTPQEVTNDPTAEPSAAPSAVPTAVPTEEPTEPTAVPEPVELAFEDCAEVAARLPWGEADNEVTYDPRFEAFDDVPGCFFVADGRIYILDRWIEGENSLLVCDTTSGETSRINVSGTKYGVQTEFAVDGSELITPYMIFNIRTGEQTLLQQPPINENAFESTRRLHLRDGEWYLYVSEPRFTSASEEENTNPLMTEYKLDRANLMWQPVRRYLRNWDYRRIQLLSGGNDVVLDRGTGIGADEYVEYDGSGCHYVVTMEYRKTDEEIVVCLVLTKYSPEGQMLSFTELRLDNISYLNDPILWHHSLRVDNDGTIWFMMMYTSELTIYKLHL